MDNKRVKELAKEHSLSVLGKEQYGKNKDARKAIESDFIAGLKAGYRECKLINQEKKL